MPLYAGAWSRDGGGREFTSSQLPAIIGGKLWLM